MFKKLIGGFAILILMATGATANADVVVVSGDGTPSFCLTDTFPGPAMPGNRQFFSNVLGSGKQVAVSGSSVNPFIGPEINEFYSSLSGVTSTLLTGMITVANLKNVDLLLLPDPKDAFTAGEIGHIRAFVKKGGSLFVMGDGVFVFGSSNVNLYVNDLLAGIGIGMSLGSSDFDDGDQFATGRAIAINPFTSGVTEYRYGATVIVTGEPRSSSLTLDSPSWDTREPLPSPNPSPCCSWARG